MSEEREEKKSCGSCASGGHPDAEALDELKDRLEVQNVTCNIKHKVIVLSGKGGVGKSTVAANMAVALSLRGKRVGLMDIDIHGPSIPKMLGLEDGVPRKSPEGLVPIQYNSNLLVVSIGFLVPNRDHAVIWRAPLKHGLIRQFITEVQWGVLDYLIVDCPPGTGDEPLSVVQLLEDADGAVVVTTPQGVAVADVRRSITFCRDTNLPVLGVIENMSGFVCPNCKEHVDIFSKGGGQSMATEMDVPFLGRIPIDPLMVESCDRGRPFMDTQGESETAKAFDPAIEKLLALDKKQQQKPE